jgi:hypothetical protein
MVYWVKVVGKTVCGTMIGSWISRYAPSWANVCPSWACSPCRVIHRPTAGANLFLEKWCKFASMDGLLGQKCDKTDDFYGSCRPKTGLRREI